MTSRLLIDHRDRDRGYYALTNLRWVTVVENCQNMSVSKANKSGHTGVHSISKGQKPWRGTIVINGKTVHYYCDTKEEAIAWRKAMELKHFIQD